MLLLALLLLNAGLGVQTAQLRHLLRRPWSLFAGLTANSFLPIAYIFVVAQTMRLWHNPEEVQHILVGLAIVAAMPIAGSSTAWTQNDDADLLRSGGAHGRGRVRPNLGRPGDPGRRRVSDDLRHPAVGIGDWSAAGARRGPNRCSQAGVEAAQRAQSAGAQLLQRCGVATQGLGRTRLGLSGRDPDHRCRYVPLGLYGGRVA